MVGWNQSTTSEMTKKNGENARRGYHLVCVIPALRQQILSWDKISIIVQFQLVLAAHYRQQPVQIDGPRPESARARGHLCSNPQLLPGKRLRFEISLQKSVGDVVWSNKISSKATMSSWAAFLAPTCRWEFFLLKFPFWDSPGFPWPMWYFLHHSLTN